RFHASNPRSSNNHRGVLYVWDMATGKELLTLRGDYGSAFALSPDGQRVATVESANQARDGGSGPSAIEPAFQIKVWTIVSSQGKARQSLAVVRSQAEPGTEMRRSLVAVGSQAEPGTEMVMEDAAASVSALAFNPDGTRLAAAWTSRPPQPNPLPQAETEL